MIYELFHLETKIKNDTRKITTVVVDDQTVRPGKNSLGCRWEMRVSAKWTCFTNANAQKAHSDGYNTFNIFYCGFDVAEI